ncbi:MAG: hypothetical protein ACSHX7_00695 [Luteolibacter sp.]
MISRTPIFTAGILILTLGILGASQLAKEPGLGFLQGALTLGGGFLICGFFSIKMPWHGVIGAGFLALIGFARGLLNLPDAFTYLTGDRSRAIAPALELIVTIICLILMTRVWKTWQKERTRRLKEDVA